MVSLPLPYVLRSKNHVLKRKFVPTPMNLSIRPVSLSGNVRIKRRITLVPKEPTALRSNTRPLFPPLSLLQGLSWILR